MTIYNVPVVGYILAVVEYNRAAKAYWACHVTGAKCLTEYDNTWVAFGHTNEAALWTIAGLIAIGAIILIIWVLGH